MSEEENKAQLDRIESCVNNLLLRVREVEKFYRRKKCWFHGWGWWDLIEERTLSRPMSVKRACNYCGKVQVKELDRRD